MIWDLDTDPWFFTLVEFPENRPLFAILYRSFQISTRHIFEHCNMKGCINMPTASRHIIRVWIWELVVQVASMMNGSMQKCCLVYPILDRFKLGKLVILPTISRYDTRCCLLVNSWSCHRSSHEQLGDDGYISPPEPRMIHFHDQQWSCSFRWTVMGCNTLIISPVWRWLTSHWHLTRAKVFSFFFDIKACGFHFWGKELPCSEIARIHLIQIILVTHWSGIPFIFILKGMPECWPFRTEDLGSIAEVTLLFGSTSRDLCHLAKHRLPILASSSGEELVSSRYNIHRLSLRRFRLSWVISFKKIVHIKNHWRNLGQMFLMVRCYAGPFVGCRTGTMNFKEILIKSCDLSK